MEAIIDTDISVCLVKEIEGADKEVGGPSRVPSSEITVT